MDFQKPKRVTLPLRPFLEKLIDGKIDKDLSENEEICPTCGGFSLTIQNNPYGLKGDPASKTVGSLFPYNHQSLVMMSCPDCYNGIVHRCPLCGEIIQKRGWLKHDCEQQKALDLAEYERKQAEIYAKAPIAPPEVERKCAVFFSDDLHDGFFSDWDEFFEEWWEEGKEKSVEKRPEYVWITEPDEFKIDAREICERATEDLYDDAYEDITDKQFDSLQAFLDEWCKNSSVGTSYHVSHKYKVRIPWEEYDKECEDESADHQS